MAEGKIEGLKPDYFGIRMRYERNTFFDDVKIVLGQLAESCGLLLSEFGNVPAVKGKE